MRRRRKTDRKETAQFVWTLLVGVAAAVAALHEAGVIREIPSPKERVPAATERTHGYSPVDILDTSPRTK
jgi:hypothetical protein